MNKEFYFLYDNNSLKSDELTKEEAQNLIPEGDYCYVWEEQPSAENLYMGKIKVCPFYDKFTQLPEQQNGFCHYLKIGDFTRRGTFLLWDMCKCCGIKKQEDDSII